MTGTRSPAAQVKEDEDRRNMRTQNRTCDFCGECTALLYCRADSAKLCLSCDLQVHSTNQLFTKHTRSQLCDGCDSTPASILCSTENSVLCHNCDWERHNQSSLSSLHERRPLEGFTGCPCVNELLTVVGFEGLCKKDLFGGDDNDLVWSGAAFGSESGVDGYSDLLVWDTPSIVTLDDLIVSNNSERTFQAMGVPPLPKNRKAAGGKYKDEILAQLRKMAKSEPNFSDGHENVEPPFGFQSLVAEQELKPGNMYTGFEHGTELDTVPSFEACAFWCNDNVEVANQGLCSKLGESNIEENCLVPDKDSDFGGSVSHASCGHEGQSHHCVVTETSNVLPRVAPRELTGQERDSAISRYKEKKKTRRYDKHVRYESRRIRAEHRSGATFFTANTPECTSFSSFVGGNSSESGQP